MPVLSYRSPREDQIRLSIGVILHVALFCTMVGLVLQIHGRIRSGHSGDFRHFYFAAGALLDHRDMYGPMPLDVVERALGRSAGPVEKAWYTTDSERYLYPPLIAMLYTPLARLRYDTAQRVILIINALLAYAGILLTARAFVERFDLPRLAFTTGSIALLGALLNVDKIHADLQMFQTNSLMFCMFALSLYLLDRKPVLAGIPLGVILNIKYLSLATLPWLIVRRRWATAASCIVSSLVFAFAPAMISGWRQNLNDLSVAYGGLLHMVGVQGSAEQANVDDIRNYLSCSITSAMARTTHRGQSLTGPMIYVLGILAVSLVLVIFLYRRNRFPVLAWPNAAKQISIPWKGMIGLEFVAVVAATLCFSPQTNTRHLMMVLLITVPMSALVLFARKGVSRIPVIAGALLIGIGFIFPPGGQAPRWHHIEVLWFGIGGQCWCLLVGMFTLLAVGLAHISAVCTSSSSSHDPSD